MFFNIKTNNFKYYRKKQFFCLYLSETNSYGIFQQNRLFYYQNVSVLQFYVKYKLLSSYI